MLNFEGVELVLVSENFISVKKSENVKWDILKPSIISSINDYFEKNEKPVLTQKQEEPIKQEEENNTVKEIKEVLDTKI